MKTYADCLLKKLDGKISYFHYEQNILQETCCE